MLRNGEFGHFLKTLREAKGFTQRQLGDAVGKNKMTISLIESGKNGPPQDKFLNRIIEVLELESEAKSRLLDYAAIPRKGLPSDIADYFIQHEELRKTIRLAMENGKENDDWRRIQEELLNG